VRVERDREAKKVGEKIFYHCGSGDEKEKEHLSGHRVRAIYENRKPPAEPVPKKVELFPVPQEAGEGDLERTSPFKTRCVGKA